MHWPQNKEREYEMTKTVISGLLKKASASESRLDERKSALGSLNTIIRQYVCYTVINLYSHPGIRKLYVVSQYDEAISVILAGLLRVITIQEETALDLPVGQFFANLPITVGTSNLK